MKWLHHLQRSTTYTWMAPVWPYWAIFCTLGNFIKACGNNNLAQIAHILRQFFKGVKIFHFSCEIFFGNFYRHLATFYWSHYWLHSSTYLLIISPKMKFIKHSYLSLTYHHVWNGKLLWQSGCFWNQPSSVQIQSSGKNWNVYIYF